ncbi:tetratricopeptide repeat protein [Pedobacter sp. Leaf250]|uniref:tetratricopeptide repeat protein n=1 Tax=Pedobacter sp. Leaf250 TaxID=2876559 RepID=UPI001E375B3F|nr:tetratricopeptide repeat protein [Pedobacter sp. Leaf250]
MKKRLLTLLIFLSTAQITFSQTKSIKDLYWDYAQIRMEDSERAQAITLAEALIKRTPELTKTQFGNVSYHLGRLYEETGETEKAIPHYEQAIKITPGYYVPYRALGFIFIKKANAIGSKMNEAAKAKDAKLSTELYGQYKAIALKALPNLEKSQACDPDEETKNIILNLYRSLKDNASILSLDDRLKSKSSACISLLEDEY